MSSFAKNFIIFIALLFPLKARSTEKQQTIAILTYYTPGEAFWDSSATAKGVTGSEEAIIYLSKQLVNLGYKVTVFGNPSPNSPDRSPLSNPRFETLDRFDPDNLYDIAIIWRSPALGLEIKPCARKLYFWPHDHAFPKNLAKEQVEAFDDVLWLSQWQRKEWVSKHPFFAKFKRIFGNGINPEEYSKGQDKKKNPYSCIYTSNYGRGLDILLDAWPSIKQRFPKASLDIYYGWQHWGLLTKEKEERMKKQILSLKHLGVTEYGLVGHEEINKAYKAASFWTYPCTGVETFCITALKAQMSGAIPVILEGSALVETVRNGYRCSRVTEYADLLVKAMEDEEGHKELIRKEAKDFVLDQYTWKAIALKWKAIFDADLASPILEPIR